MGLLPQTPLAALGYNRCSPGNLCLLAALGYNRCSDTPPGNLCRITALGYNRCSETPLVTSGCWLLLANNLISGPQTPLAAN